MKRYCLVQLLVGVGKNPNLQHLDEKITKVSLELKLLVLIKTLLVSVFTLLQSKLEKPKELVKNTEIPRPVGKIPFLGEIKLPQRNCS